MASKRNRPRSPSSKPASSGARTPLAPASPPARTARDARPYIYGLLNALLAALQLYVMLDVTPNRHAWAQALLLGMPACTLLMGISTVAGRVIKDPKRSRIAWIVAVAGGTATLLLTVVVLGLLLMSAAFLSGVYGAFGKGAAFGVLAGAALIVELVAVIPVLQLKYLMTRGGRRAFGLAPLWSRA